MTFKERLGKRLNYRTQDGVTKPVDEYSGQERRNMSHFADWVVIRRLGRRRVMTIQRQIETSLFIN